MASLQSYFFRIVMGRLTGLLNTRSSVEGWRALSATGSKAPRLPRGVTSQAVQAGGVSCEWLCPAGVQNGPRASTPGVFHKTILYLHGGGFLLGWYNSHRWLVAHFANACGACALAVDYRLAPEHPFPAALDDCLAVYRSLLQGGTDPGKIIFAGDSAGGNLVLTMLLALKDTGEPLPAAGVCLSPVTDFATRAPSYQTNARTDAALPLKFIDAVGPAYLAGADPLQPLISPLYGDLRGLPPLLVQAGGAERLRDDAIRFAEKARQAGVDVTLTIYPHMWHVWQIFTPYLPEANRALREAGLFTRRTWGEG